MSIKFELDASEFTKSIRQYQKLRKKDDEEIVVDRSGKLAFELYKVFRKAAPKVSLLKGLPAKLGYRIKRKFKYDTVAEEISRRIDARFAASSGWIPALQRFSKRNVKMKKGKVLGSFQINLSEPSVTIINGMKEAVAADSRHRLLQQAINNQTRDMNVYIQRKLDEAARKFSAK